MPNRAECKRRRKRIWQIVRILNRRGPGEVRGENRRRMLGQALRLATSIYDDL